MKNSLDEITTQTQPQAPKGAPKATNGHRATAGNGTTPTYSNRTDRTTPQPALNEADIRRTNQCPDPHCECHSANGKVHCPAHDDANPSLSVSTANGRVLWKCFSGCTQEAVTAAITPNSAHSHTNGYRADHAPTKPKAKRAPRVNWKTATIYEYLDESGVLLFQVGRIGHGKEKQISQRRPDGHGGWIYKLENTRRVLYNLADVLKAKTVLLVEGEKATDHINAELKAANLYDDIVATTNPQGAGKWRAEYSPTLAGKIVAIFPDHDKPGQTHAGEVARSLHGIADSVKVVDLPDLADKQGADDWLNAGHTISDLLATADAAPEWNPDANTVQSKEIPAPSMFDDKGNAEYDPAQLLALLHPHWPVQNLATHAAHAQRIRDHLGEVLCYSPNLGWLVYDGRVWQRDDKHATKTAARVATLTQAVRNEGAILYRFAATLAQVGRENDAKAMSKAAATLLRHTKQIESKAFIEGALHLAAGLLAVETERFDQKPWVIGFQNGTWDKGQWREHRREDYLLHLSPVHLDFNADRSEWLTTLDRITGSDCELARMVQDMAGYILSGASHLRHLPFLYGPKGTGKSTYAELLQTVLGDMAASIDPKKLQDSAARERLGADLWNRRLAVCGEAGSQRLEAELLKTLSGSDRLAVRFLFREAFTAPPRHVLLMVTNDPPRMDAYDAALKDRVIALPFTHPLDNGTPLELTGGRRIEAVRQDHETPLVRGFAAWAMEGLARVWHSQEIYRAKCAETATAQFWADTDQLTPFWETIEEAELLAGIGKTELRKRYETWCEAEGARAFNRTQWARACEEGHGLKDEKRTGGKRFWYLPKKALVAQVAQLRPFSKDTREEDKVPRVQFENKASCATCATNGTGTISVQDDHERGEV